ncbi:GTP-binding protein [Saccharothrix sp. HUAS TT10]|uniref:GTP-binding protein n=1 Tax=Saccharothrix sp. HUAS TT10 TaxID=3447450 RepID=UPI003F711CC4
MREEPPDLRFARSRHGAVRLPRRREDHFDTILIESTGISEPMPVAATFEWTFEDGTSLSDHARLDTIVTVVDASNFLPELERGDRLDDRDLAAAEEEHGIRSVTYRADRPFHPARLVAALADGEGVVRSKGFCHIPSRPHTFAVWSQAGPNMTIEPGELLTDDAVGRVVEQGRDPRARSVRSALVARGRRIAG